MTSAAKRARQKANRAKRLTPEVKPEAEPEAPLATESEHAAAMQALAVTKRLRKRLTEDD